MWRFCWSIHDERCRFSQRVSLRKCIQSWWSRISPQPPLGFCALSGRWGTFCIRTIFGKKYAPDAEMTPDAARIKRDWSQFSPVSKIHMDPMKAAARHPHKKNRRSRLVQSQSVSLYTKCTWGNQHGCLAYTCFISMHIAIFFRGENIASVSHQTHHMFVQRLYITKSTITIEGSKHKYKYYYFCAVLWLLLLHTYHNHNIDMSYLCLPVHKYWFSHFHSYMLNTR